MHVACVQCDGVCIVSKADNWGCVGKTGGMKGINGLCLKLLLVWISVETFGMFMFKLVLLKPGI